MDSSSNYRSYRRSFGDILSNSAHAADSYPNTKNTPSFDGVFLFISYRSFYGTMILISAAKAIAAQKTLSTITCLTCLTSDITIIPSAPDKFSN